MATVTFDTLKFANKLKTAGVPDKQAEAEAEAISEVIQANFKDLVTKEDLRRELNELEIHFDTKLKEFEMRFDARLKELEMRFDAKLDRQEGKFIGEFTQVRGEITLIKWMLGVLLAGVISLVLKAFFV